MNSSDMAPEVGLNSGESFIGYGRSADVYSFGVLLWELSAKEKPFSDIRTADEFKRRVFVGGARPVVDARRWPGPVCSLIECCWDADPEHRPSMVNVQATLILHICSKPVATRRTRARVNRRLTVSAIQPKCGCVGAAKPTEPG